AGEGQRKNVEKRVRDDRPLGSDGLDQSLEDRVGASVDVPDGLHRDLRVDQVPGAHAESVQVAHEIVLAEGGAGGAFGDGPHAGGPFPPPSPRPRMRSTLRRTARARFSIGGPMRLPSSRPTPRPFSRPSSIASTIRRASRMSSSDGAKTRLAIATWFG